MSRFSLPEHCYFPSVTTKRQPPPMVRALSSVDSSALRRHVLGRHFR